MSAGPIVRAVSGLVARGQSDAHWWINQPGHGSTRAHMAANADDDVMAIAQRNPSLKGMRHYLGPGTGLDGTSIFPVRGYRQPTDDEIDDVALHLHMQDA